MVSRWPFRASKTTRRDRAARPGFFSWSIYYQGFLNIQLLFLSINIKCDEELSGKPRFATGAMTPSLVMTSNLVSLCISRNVFSHILIHENILNNNYFLKRVDADDGSIFSEDLQDLLPQNLQQMQATTSVSLEEPLPVYLIILLIVVGILVGILGTCSVLVFVDYKNNPKFDTSGVVTYTRRRNFEKLYVDPKQRDRLERQRRQMTAASRTPLPVPGRVSRASRESELLRSSREATESLRLERKNSY
ncbi:hypothetical protein Y032_0058g2881 [Ancylostoma ceylanicum]|uniref:Uncharacterized protein n=1 Tax=Ancylostoma ceylanicum TaxID=53326 RepID=A0A016U419_9BILA|nr:hypothetical protein Y032_0058g2881 [Ancylostoma ceylanicum]